MDGDEAFAGAGAGGSGGADGKVGSRQTSSRARNRLPCDWGVGLSAER
jgi:hypothetical protein